MLKVAHSIVFLSIIWMAPLLSAQNGAAIDVSFAGVEGDAHAYRSRTGDLQGWTVGASDFTLAGASIADGWFTLSGSAYPRSEEFRFEGDLDLYEKGRYTVAFENFTVARVFRSAELPVTTLETAGLGVQPLVRRRELKLGGQWNPFPKIEVALRYTHRERSGEKPSLRYGVRQFDTATVRGTNPALLLLDERRDRLEVEVKRVDGDATDTLVLGIERQRSDNGYSSLALREGTEGSIGVLEAKGNESDIISLHSHHSRIFSEQLRGTFGAAYFSLEGQFSGKRVFRENYDPGLTLAFRRIGQTGLGYTDLEGESQLRQYRIHANLQFKPVPRWQWISTLQLERTFREAMSAFTASERKFQGGTLDVLTDLRWARGEEAFTEGTLRLEARRLFKSGHLWRTLVLATYGAGDLSEFLQVASSADLAEPDTTALAHIQEYSRRSLQVQSRYRHRFGTKATLLLQLKGRWQENDYTPRLRESERPVRTIYPSYIQSHTMQSGEAQLRWTYRPASGWRTVSQLSYRHAERESAAVGDGGIKSGEQKAWILGQSLSCQPHRKWLLFANIQYTHDRQTTPAADISGQYEGVLETARNDYFTGQVQVTHYLDAKTDLVLSALVYVADNSPDLPEVAAAYGYDLDEWRIGATLRHRWSPRLVGQVSLAVHDYEEASFNRDIEFTALVTTLNLNYAF
jgi:hypothetical protein